MSYEREMVDALRRIGDLLEGLMLQRTDPPTVCRVTGGYTATVDGAARNLDCVLPADHNTLQHLDSRRGWWN